MSDLAPRLVLISVVLLIAGVVIAILRKRDSTAGRLIGPVDFQPGIYFFTSSTCAECEPARAALLEKLGQDGFVEFSWEEDVDKFRALGVEVVPATVLVAESGTAEMWAGHPKAMFSIVDP